MRKRGQRIPEPRVLVEAAPLIEKAKRKLKSGYEMLASILGISKTTLLDYKSGRALMPISVYRLLKHIVGEPLDHPKTLSPYWGQQKGGLKSGGKAHLTRSQARLMAHKSHLARRSRRKQLVSKLAREIQRTEPILFAEFVGRMLGDGSISLFPKYFPSEYENHVRMRAIVKSLFNHEPKTVKRDKYYETRLPRISVQILNEIGIPIGKKSITNPVVPKFIMKSEDHEVIKAFIRGYFDDEAYVSKSRIEVSSAVRLSDEELCEHLRRAFKKRSISAKVARKLIKGFKPPRPNVLKGIKSLLHKLGIQASLKCARVLFNKTSISVEWKLVIAGRNFHKALENNLISLWKLKKLDA